MSGAIVTIEIGGVKYAVDTSVETIKVLRNGATLTTAGITMHDIETNADYQVPAGKTFTILGIKGKSSNTSRIITVEQSDDADTGTNAVTKAALWTDISAELFTVGCGHLPTVAAEKYVNARVNNVTSTPTLFEIIGVEE